MQAILTKTWNEALDGALDATELFKKNHVREVFDDWLASAMPESGGGTLTIRGLDALFRRRLNGFNSIKALVGAIATYESETRQRNVEVICGCNALVYGFLVGAKNFDFILPEVNDKSVSSFRQVLPFWKSTISQLEAFERDGDALSDTDLRTAYLKLRPIMTRPAARDEHRSLCALLMSGPSTLEEITKDFGLPYNLSKRVIAPFVSAGIVEKIENTERYVITETAMPLSLFLVRESLGVDPLTTLGD